MSLRKDIKRRQRHRAQQNRKQRSQRQTPELAKPLKMEKDEASSIYAVKGGCHDANLNRSLARIYKSS